MQRRRRDGGRAKFGEEWRAARVGGEGREGEGRDERDWRALGRGRERGAVLCCQYPEPSPPCPIGPYPLGPKEGKSQRPAWGNDGHGNKPAPTEDFAPQANEGGGGGDAGGEGEVGEVECARPAVGKATAPCRRMDEGGRDGNRCRVLLDSPPDPPSLTAPPGESMDKGGRGSYPLPISRNGATTRSRPRVMSLRADSGRLSAAPAAMTRGHEERRDSTDVPPPPFPIPSSPGTRH